MLTKAASGSFDAPKKSRLGIIMEITVYRNITDAEGQLPVNEAQLAIYPKGEEADSGKAAWRLVRRENTLDEKGKLNVQYDYSKMGSSLEYEFQIPKGSKSSLKRLQLEGFERSFFDFGHESEKLSRVIYVESGQCQVTFGDEDVLMEEGNVFVATCAEEKEDTKIEVCGLCTLISGEVDFTFVPCEEPEIEAAKFASFDDFKKCIFIANTQFRWAKYIFKSLRNQWYDEALTAAIWKIERFYVTMFAMMFGLGAIVISGAALLTWPVTLALALAWIILFQLVIAPLCFLAVVPKPVAAHIKKIDELNQYERNIYESQKGVDQRMDHLMKKYKKPALSKKPGEETNK